MKIDSKKQKLVDGLCKSLLNYWDRFDKLERTIIKEIVKIEVIKDEGKGVEVDE